MFFCCLGNKLLLQVYWCTYREAANSAVKKTSFAIDIFDNNCFRLLCRGQLHIIGEFPHSPS